MNSHKGMSVQPKVPNKFTSVDPPVGTFAQDGNPDLEVGAVHKVRIQRDIDGGAYGIYWSEVKAVYPTFYQEEVSFPKTHDRQASKRIECFQKSDHRFGIGSCNLNGDDLDD